MAILLILQFTIGFIALTFGFGLVNYVMQYKKSVEKIVPLESVHLYMNGQDDLAEHNLEIVKKYHSLFEQIKSEGLAKQVGLFELLHIYTESEEDTERLYVLNKDSLSMQNFDFEMGGIKELLQYDNSKVIPIVVSDDMKSVYEFGKVYDFSYLDAQGEEKSFEAKVAGVLSSDTRYWAGGASIISENVVNNKSFIIAPQFIEYQEELTYMYNAILNPLQDNNAVEEITQVFTENELDIECMTLREETEKYYESQKTIILGMFLFAGILLFLSVLGSVGSILSSISMRYREFGVYYSLGASKHIIVKMVLGEIFFILSFSFFLSTGICFTFSNTVLKEIFLVDIWVIGSVFIMMLFCAILCMIMPYIKMKQVEPVELVKGIDY